MKILFIFHVSIIDGGASKSGLNLIKGLVASGIQVAVVIPKVGELYNELVKLGIPVRTIQFYWAFPRFYSNLKSTLRFFPDFINQRIINRKAIELIAEFAIQQNVNLIHSNSSVIDVGFKAAKKIGIPHITHNREFGFKDCTAVMWHIKKQLCHPLSYSINITKCIQDYRNLKDTSKHIIVYNGMYPASAAQFNPEKKSYFLYVGAISRQKGIEDMLTAYGKTFSKYRKPPILKIAGDYTRTNPDFYNHLKSICKEFNVTEHVEWLGKREDVSSLMRDALAIVIPSHNEAFGRVMAEAMFNGCLVIGRDKAGLKEQFDNGYNCTREEIGIRFNDVEDLSNRLTQVLGNGIDPYLRMTKLAQECAVKLYSNESYIQNISNFYKLICKE